MKKLLITSILYATSISVVQACEITPSMKMQFCAEIMSLKEGQTAEVKMDGIPPSDFTIKPILNHALRITYTGEITENKRGELIVKNESGEVVTTRPMSISTKDHTEGYEKVKRGFSEFMSSLKGD